MVKRNNDTLVLPKNSATIGKLIEILSARYGKSFAGLFSNDPNSSPLVTIFLNGQNVKGTSEDTVLSDDSEVEVSLVSQMTGG